MSAHPGFDVEGRIALVTGSSRGIGYALATGLAEARAVVVLNGRDTDALERSRDDIADATGAVVWAQGPDTFPDDLPDRVKWVQLPSAGVEPWIAAGIIDSTRTWTSAAGVYAHKNGETPIQVSNLAAMLQEKGLTVDE
jgi:NAD(P)-dependent dehydrogenase (short-subunit alcohol dehydrogenase family)